MDTGDFFLMLLSNKSKAIVQNVFLNKLNEFILVIKLMSFSSNPPFNNLPYNFWDCELQITFVLHQWTPVSFYL